MNQTISQTAPAVRINAAAANSIPFRERLRTVRTAFLSVPSRLQSPETIRDARHLFSSIRVKPLEAFTDRRAEWRRDLMKYLSQVDACIVVTDESRFIGGGVIREIKTARAQGKLIVLFNSQSKQWERYCGHKSFKTAEGRWKAALNKWQPRTDQSTEILQKSTEIL